MSVDLALPARFAYRGVLKAAPPPMARRIRYLRRFGLKGPRTFNERLAASLILERDPRMPTLTDKIAAKAFIAEKLGPEWITPTLFAGEALPPIAERDWTLPYVIKPSHRANSEIALVRSAAERSWPEIEARCRTWTASQYRGSWFEWYYEHIPPRILVEPYLGDGETAPPDYKFFVFGGKVAVIEVDLNRFVGHRRSLYDRGWNLLPYTNKAERPRIDGLVERPRHLDRMIAATELIGSEWTFVRVDLYDFADGPRFGEFTFCPQGAIGKFDPPEYDRVMGDLWPRRRPVRRRTASAGR